MDILVTLCLFVLSLAVVVIGAMLTRIASDIRKTRQALERLEPAARRASASTGRSLEEESPRLPKFPAVHPSTESARPAWERT